jgi:hypothetical protein
LLRRLHIAARHDDLFLDRGAFAGLGRLHRRAIIA